MRDIEPTRTGLIVAVSTALPGARPTFFSSRSTCAKDTEVPRLVHIVLMIVLGAPTLAWGGTLPGNTFPGTGIALVSPTCCEPALQTGQQPTETELSSACCCKPHPATPGTESQHTILSQVVSGVVQQPAPVDIPVAPIAAAHISLAKSGFARGPPPLTSLYSLHIALLV